MSPVGSSGVPHLSHTCPTMWDTETPLSSLIQYKLQIGMNLREIVLKVQPPLPIETQPVKRLAFFVLILQTFHVFSVTLQFLLKITGRPSFVSVSGKSPLPATGSNTPPHPAIARVHLQQTIILMFPEQFTQGISRRGENATEGAPPGPPRPFFRAVTPAAGIRGPSGRPRRPGICCPRTRC